MDLVLTSFSRICFDALKSPPAENPQSCKFDAIGKINRYLKVVQSKVGKKVS